MGGCSCRRHSSESAYSTARWSAHAGHQGCCGCMPLLALSNLAFSGLYSCSQFTICLRCCAAACASSWIAEPAPTPGELWPVDLNWSCKGYCMSAPRMCSMLNLHVRTFLKFSRRDCEPALCMSRLDDRFRLNRHSPLSWPREQNTGGVRILSLLCVCCHCHVCLARRLATSPIQTMTSL
jgi:hypothetical protein